MSNTNIPTPHIECRKEYLIANPAPPPPPPHQAPHIEWRDENLIAKTV